MSGLNAKVAALSFGFAGSMLLHEIVMEGLWKSFRGKGNFPDAIGFYVAVFQFGCSAMGALLIKLFKQVAGGGAKTPLSSPRAQAPAYDLGIGTTDSGGEASTPAALAARARRLAGEWGPYVGLTVLIFLSTALANQSVNYVPYVLKVVFKSSKLMPTMLVSTLMGNSKSFSTMDYTAAVLLCVGSAGFAYGSGKTEEGKALWSLLLGCLLLGISICSDAFVPNAQQRVMSQKVSPEDLMFKTNILGTFMIIAGMMAMGEFWPCIEFSIREPHANVNLVLAGSTLFTAAFCMISLVKRAGSVFAVAVGTARKAASVVISYVIFPKKLTALHILSLLCVGTGMVLNEYNNQVKKAAQKAQKATLPSALDKDTL